MIIFVNFTRENSNFLAYAAPCKLSDFDKRPEVGMIMINLNQIENLRDKLSLSHTLLHETLHILAMSPLLYKHFHGSMGVQFDSRTSRQFLNTKNLVQMARQHFQCAEIHGVYLENQGNASSAGSHFEKIYFGNELMTSQLTGDPVLSVFTLAILEDSGWYFPNYTLA